MKKCLCFLTIMVIVFSLFSFVSFATEKDPVYDPEEDRSDINVSEPFFRYMGDIDNDGNVTASDARVILRTSVSLEDFHENRLAYADMDYNGVISAADARLALRTSVSLEECVSHDFSACNESRPTCIEEGKITGECSHCKQIINITVPKEAHWPEYVNCSGKTRCVVCRAEYDIAPVHAYYGYICAECGDIKEAEFYDFLTDYIKTNGVFEDGVYYIEEYTEYENFSVCYDDTADYLYAVAGTAFEAENGQIVYYYNFIDFEPSFSEYTVELDCYLEDTFIGYGVYSLDETKLNSSVTGSLTLEEYDSIPELSGMQTEIQTISEGLTYDTIYWLDSYVARTFDCDASRIMGFNEM